ncbi:lambda-exonuclease family protein [Azospirillum sp. SYSU D00513]|uniref:YqaJ viral recombinase family nuclease n=1 Tax=Azospirillum sp. SYSU D00513 TaxID=2812561 RepID=UPI001A96E350|nr:YqaJ viral recombinase family protein [Azospirillum sp. SYSU D00513]
MKIVNVRQGSAEWLAWRDKGVSASDMAIILGLSPYKSLWRLWAEKAGVVPPEDLSGNMFVAHGKRSEPAVRRWFESKHDTMLLPACAESSDTPIIRASFDGLSDDGIPVELKAPSDAVFDDVVALREDADAYRLYACQVQTQIYVSGMDHGYLVFGRVVETETGELVVEEALEFRIDRDEAFVATMIQKATAFMDAVARKKEPAKDPARDLYAPLSDTDQAAWNAAAAEYKAAEAEIEALKARITEQKAKQDDAEKRMVTLMGQFAQADAGGIQIKRYLQKGNVNYTTFLADRKINVSEQDLDKYRGATQERVKVTIQKPKKADTPTPLLTPAVAAE